MSPAATPRPGVRDMAPYVSPQLEVAARLNTNECPHPLPEGFSEGLASAIRDLPLHRYPDGQVTRLREDLAAHLGHPVEGTWPANGSNEVLTELLLAYGGPGRTAAIFEPTYQLHARMCWLTHTNVASRRLDDVGHATSPFAAACALTHRLSTSDEFVSSHHRLRRVALE